jgi:hypothetical protein
MTVTDIDLHSIEFVCLNLRAADRLEVLGLCDHSSTIRLAHEVNHTIRTHGRGRIVWHAGKPAAVLGFAEYRPGVWQAILLGTDAFPSIAKTALRWFRETARELRDDLGARRVHVDSHIDHWQAHKFLRALGAKPEGPPMLEYGKDGASYQRFVWLAKDQPSFIKGKTDVLYVSA